MRPVLRSCVAAAALCQCSGKALLVVNTASQRGYTAADGDRLTPLSGIAAPTQTMRGVENPPVPVAAAHDL